MDLKNISWPTVAAILFVVILCVTLVLPNVSDVVVLALGFSGVTAAVLSLRDK
jgi:hypothetical protein